MKKIIMSGLMVIMALSVLRGAAAGTTAEAKSKTASHRCSIVKGCRVTGKHHSKKHHVKPRRVKKNYTVSHHSVSHHPGHHNYGSHHR